MRKTWKTLRRECFNVCCGCSCCRLPHGPPDFQIKWTKKPKKKSQQNQENTHKKITKTISILDECQRYLQFNFVLVQVENESESSLLTFFLFLAKLEISRFRFRGFGVLLDQGYKQQPVCVEVWGWELNVGRTGVNGLLPSVPGTTAPVAIDIWRRGWGLG